MTTQNPQNTKAKNKPISYYGKKVYVIHPMLARLKVAEVKKPDFRDNNVDEKIDK